MAGIQLDDLLGKKKEAPQVLDLSRSIVQSQEEFRKLLERVPEYKIRPEKALQQSKEIATSSSPQLMLHQLKWLDKHQKRIREDDVKIKDKDMSFQPIRKEFKQVEYAYSNPIPPDMRSVPLEDLNGVAIDWKMLTSIRPKSKQDEEMFSKLVMMGKLHLRTAAREKREDQSNLIARHKNRAGIIETKVKVCGECGDEFCNGGSCGKFLYDCFLRVAVGTIYIDPSGNDKPSGKSASPSRGRPKSDKKKKKPQKRSRSAKRKKKSKIKSGKRKKKDKHKD